MESRKFPWWAVVFGLLASICFLVLTSHDSRAVAAVGEPASATGEDSAAASGWKSAPVVPDIRGKVKRRLRDRVDRGRDRGMRRNVFAKVGDSNIEMTPALYGLACADPVPALSRRLRRVVRRYSRVRLANPRAFPGCTPWNSFSRRSAAAQSGTHSSWSLIPGPKLPATGFLALPEDCEPDETPLGCELRVTRPRYAFVHTGSNDIWLDLYLGNPPGSRIRGRLRKVVNALLAEGTVPILGSIPPIVRGEGKARAIAATFVSRTNAGIRRLARRRHLPFVNLWRAMSNPRMINSGMSEDGLHLSVFNAGGESYVREVGPTTFADSVVFTRRGLRYGSNRRNLILLKTLARLDRATR